MTQTDPHVIWTDTVDGQTYRLVDRGSAADPRFVLEQQAPPDALGGVGWSQIGLPLSNVLERAFSALYGAA